MSEINYEAEQLAANFLVSALKKIQSAESDLSRAHTATGDVGLKHRLDDYMGALSLVRDSGNREHNKLRDLLDPS